jgi:hypothetical protein
LSFEGRRKKTFQKEKKKILLIPYLFLQENLSRKRMCHKNKNWKI